MLLGLGLIVVELIWKARFLHRFYFRQDDFHFTELALQHGLSWKYLGYVGSGHLHPGVLLLVWVVAKAAPYDWAAATWMTLILVAVAGVACLRMLRTLLGDRLAVLIPLTLFLVTPLTFPDDSWWTSAIESLPLQITIFLAVTSHVHYVRCGRYRHAAAAAFWLVIGLAFFEKAVVIPVVLFVLTAGFLINNRIFASVRLALARYWRAWALYVVILAAYVAILLPALQKSTVKPKPTSIGTMLTFAWSLIRQTLVPGLFGGPWRWSQTGFNAIAYAQTTSSLVWLTAFAACALIAVSIAVRARAWRAWAILALWVLLADVVPMLLGRLATAGFAQVLGLDTRYVADAAPVAALTIALAFWPVVRDTSQASPVRSGRPAQDYFGGAVWQAFGVALTAVVALSSVASVNSYEKATALYNYAGNVYLLHARAYLTDLPAGTVIADRPMIPVVMWNIYYLSYADQSVALAPMESRTTRKHVRWATHFDGNIDRLMMFDPYGNLLKANVDGVRAVPPAGKHCAPVRKGVMTLRFAQPSRQTSGILRIGYLAGTPSASDAVTVRYGSTVLSLTLQKGLHSAYFSISGSAASVTVTVPRSTGLCVGDAEAGNLTPSRH